MANYPLLGPTPIPIGDDTLHPHGNACFTCTPPYGHPREWEPHPATPGRKRTLVVCFDGTGDSFDQDNSNVVQFLAMLKKDDPMEQLVYYQAGIGTYTGNNVLGTPIVQGASQLLDQMVAWNLPSHIKDGYQFLMQNYHVGDQICIFGFSRGAFTARALAGMLQKVGLLPQSNSEQLPFAYSMYARDDDEGLKLSMQFKRTFSVDVKIQFLGVWDTVQSVGLVPKHLPFSGSNNAIVHFRHALSLDEHRVKFIPFFCTGGKPKHDPTDTKASHPDDSVSHDRRRQTERRQHSEGSQTEDYENQVNTLTGPDSDVEEVFFAGAHCDIGGGSVQNGTRHSLARIPLRWMIRECFKTNTGIIFDAHMLMHEVGLDINSLSQAPNPLPPQSHTLDSPGPNEIRGFTLRRVPVAVFSGLTLPFRWLWGKTKRLRLQKPPKVLFSFEQERFKYEGEPAEELQDALSPVYDQLDLHWYWKVMEWIPWIMKKQSAEVADSDDFWAYKLVWNRGQGRQVYNLVIRRGMKVHRSVRLRMLAQGTDGNGKLYLPQIRCMVNGRVRRLTREEWLEEESHLFEWVN